VSNTGECESPPLRIGCLLDSPRAPAWVAHVLAEIQGAKCFELAMVLIAPKGAAKRERSLWRRLSQALYRLYEWADYKVFRATRDALARVDLGNLCAEVPCLRLATFAEGAENPLTGGDTSAVSAAGLDVLLDFSALEVRGRMQSCVKYGIWRCHPGEPRPYNEMPPLFEEMYRNHEVSETVLQCLVQGHEGARVLYRGSFATNYTSLYLNRNVSAWKSARYILRRLTDLHQHGWDYLNSLYSVGAPDEYCARSEPSPGTLTTCRFVTRILSRFLSRRMYSWFRCEKWGIAYRARAAPPQPGEGRRFLLPGPDRFYADPFCYSRHGKHYIFFEDYRYESQKAVISYVEIDSLAQHTAPQVALSADYHLSYPFLFEWQGDVYLMPETSTERRIEVYRAVEFPCRWVRDRVVMDNVGAVDATLLSHGGLFWLFAATESPSGGYDTELSAFYAETPLGPWTPHRHNPVVTDVRSARPAGGFFMIGDALIRPGQDCSERYGGAVTLSQVDLLTPTEYREHTVAKLPPIWEPGCTGTHTISRTAEFEALDLILSWRRLPFGRSRPFGRNLGGAFRNCQGVRDAGGFGRNEDSS
jgi:hypothetical protein